MKKITWLTTIPVLVAVLSSNRAHAFTFTQVGDAGETLNTAQVISPASSQPLDAISGTLIGNADVFKIYLTGGQNFSASTVSNYTLNQLPGAIAQAENYNAANLLSPTKVDTLLDPALALFDSTGKGIYSNDNSFGSAQPTLTSAGLSPTQSGYYYLAIFNSGSLPVDASTNPIFPTNLTQDQEIGPTNPNSSFTGFTSSSTINPVQGIPNYTIFLTGAQAGAQAAAIPEPSSMLGIWAVGALGAVAFLKKEKQQHKPVKFDSNV